MNKRIEVFEGGRNCGKTYARGQVKTRPVTLKRDYVSMLLESTKREYDLKRHNASLEDNLRDANNWTNKYQQDLIDLTEKRDRRACRGFFVGLTIGFIVGVIVITLIK